MQEEYSRSHAVHCKKCVIVEMVDCLLVDFLCVHIVAAGSLVVQLVRKFGVRKLMVSTYDESKIRTYLFDERRIVNSRAVETFVIQ